MIVLDYRDKRPIYEQVVEKLEHLIVCGALAADTKMPSVRALALDLSVNPNTIQRAYAQLEQDGYLYSIVGRGNFVAGESEWKSGKMEETLTEVRQAITKARDIGIDQNDIRNMLSEIYAASQKQGGQL